MGVPGGTGISPLGGVPGGKGPGAGGVPGGNGPGGGGVPGGNGMGPGPGKPGMGGSTITHALNSSLLRRPSLLTSIISKNWSANCCMACSGGPVIWKPSGFSVPGGGASGRTGPGIGPGMGPGIGGCWADTEIRLAPRRQATIATLAIMVALLWLGGEVGMNDEPRIVGTGMQASSTSFPALRSIRNAPPRP
jgi:hypothetical protein